MAVMFVLPVCAIESRAGGLPSAPRSDRPVPNAVGTQAESAKPSSPKSPDEAPKRQIWHSMSMEASAILGEMKFQYGDFSGAQETFRDSLNSRV
jgi:hypothetical protein